MNAENEKTNAPLPTRVSAFELNYKSPPSRRELVVSNGQTARRMIVTQNVP